jgi:hypothetical protein
MAKKIDPKAKAKKQKIYAAVGGVLLLGLLAFQVPRTLKMLHPPADPSATSTTPAVTTTPATTPVAAPSLSGGNAAPAPTGRDGLADSDPVSAPQSGQLLAFGLFRTKDPFVQQINLRAAATSGAPPSSTGTTGPTGVTPTNPTSGAPSTGGGSNVVPVTPTNTARTGAKISVNGVAESVQVGGKFPTSDPFFKLVSVSSKSVKISIAGGALANGSATVTLTKAKALTLQNTADGTRYVLRLLSVS